jgi:hypothetical protein
MNADPLRPPETDEEPWIPAGERSPVTCLWMALAALAWVAILALLERSADQ